jgi:hypothetical protein
MLSYKAYMLAHSIISLVWSSSACLFQHWVTDIFVWPHAAPTTLGGMLVDDRDFCLEEENSNQVPLAYYLSVLPQPRPAMLRRIESIHMEFWGWCRCQQGGRLSNTTQEGSVQSSYYLLLHDSRASTASPKEVSSSTVVV